MFESQRTELLRNLDAAHAAYYAAPVFGGPSLHFHLRALTTAQTGDVASFALAAYAMLASWGMQRAGRSGPQLCKFGKFAASLQTVWPLITGLQQTLPHQLVDKHWADLTAVFSGIDAMASRSSLVGTSKVMAHALPRLVAPVDRRYTLRFLFGSEQVRNDKPAEWATLRRCLQDFFYPVAASPKFIVKAEAWMKQSVTFRWDTSPLKVVDNLLVGFQQPEPAHQA